MVGLVALRPVAPRSAAQRACPMRRSPASSLRPLDAAGILRAFVAGHPGAHADVGGWFHSPGEKVSDVRSVTMDRQGKVLITEHDAGFIRKIEFLRLPP
jgi:hypothetical protein